MVLSLTARWRLVAVAVVLLSAWNVPADPQHDFSDEPLLASGISEHDIEMRGRYARQWKDEEETLVVVFQGGFRLDMGHRRLSASNAVVWITPRRAEDGGRKYHELTVYLSEDAEVREPGGTVTLANVLLIRGLRTYGGIVKHHDAHAPERLEQSPLVQQAIRDRALIESGVALPQGETPQVTRPDEIRTPRADRPPRLIRYRLPNIEPAETPEGERVFVATGGVYFSQDGGPDAPVLEVRAQNAVVFPMGETASLFGQGVEGERREPAESEGDEDLERLDTSDEEPVETEREKTGGALGLGAAGEQSGVSAVYLEGDVVLSLGNRFVRADRLYYDFERDRAIILDAVFRAEIPIREIPLYIRASEIRQLSAREFSAENAVVTTSEFYTPSYHVGADWVKLRDETERGSEGQAVGPIAGTYELKNATLNVEGLPLLWWPYSRGNIEASETLLRRMRTSYSGDMGMEFESSWYLFNLLGAEPPPGYDATLRMDYFSKRGPATGVNLDYERETHYGLFRSYYIHDDGEDDLGPLRRADEAPSTSERGRVLWRHRHYLPYDWEATLETAYISDPNFLEEYERSEFHEGKEQETLIYLKRAREVDAITFLANWRLLDFLTQTEHLPEVTYRRIGDTFLDPLVLYHESRIGAVRYRPDDRHFIDHPLFRNTGGTDVTFRGDVRQEAELPLKLGPFNLVPFSAVRGTIWDGQPMADGGLWRGMGVHGVRGGISFSRVFDDVHSELFDIHRIRHIIKPDFAAWWSHGTARSEEITPFDYGIETIDDFYGFMAGLRQTWQTKRGAPDRRRTVDLLTFNMEVGIFGDTDGRDDMSNGWVNSWRPENSRTRNYAAADLIYRLSDTTSLFYDINVDLNDGAVDRQNVSLAVERNPRLAYVIGTRYAGDIDMNFVGGGWNYRLSQKHITSVRTWYDIDSGDLGEISVAYIRKLPRWYIGLNFEYDRVDDDFTVSISLWPQGIPEWALGSRRFTGLATTTGIRP